MKNLKFVLIEQDNADQVLNVKGIYSYREAFEILENGYKNLGGELYVPNGNHDWLLNGIIMIIMEHIGQ